MGEIRSAIDIAMEKTAHIEGDASGAANRALRNEGKKAASEYLEKQDPDILLSPLSGKKKDDILIVREGMIQIFLASIRLPTTEEDTAKTAYVGAGLEAVLPQSGMADMFGQVEQIMKQYLIEQDNLKKTLEQQFAPRLRAKQQEMERRYGQKIPIELHQDPEYIAALSKNKRMLEQRYGAVIEEIRARIREAAGMTDEE